MMSKLTGIELIAAERERQITAEGWTFEKEDLMTSRQLTSAAMCHLSVLTLLSKDHILFHERFWPFPLDEWFAPGSVPLSRIGTLSRAGALIAAEIDRLQRATGGTEG